MVSDCRNVPTVAVPLATEWLLWVLLAVAHFYLVYGSSLEMYAGWQKAKQDGSEVLRNINKLTILGTFIILMGFIFQLQSVHNQGAVLFAGTSYITQSLGWCQFIHGFICHFIPFIFYSALIHFWFLKLQTAFKKSAMAPDETFIYRYRCLFASMIIVEFAVLILISIGHDCVRSVRVVDAALLLSLSSNRVGKWCHNRNLVTRLTYVIVGGSYLTFFNAWLTYEFWSKLSESAHRATRMKSYSEGSALNSNNNRDNSSHGSRKHTMSIALPAPMPPLSPGGKLSSQSSEPSVSRDMVTGAAIAASALNRRSPSMQASPLSLPDFSSKPVGSNDFSLMPRLHIALTTSSSTESVNATPPDDSVNKTTVPTMDVPSQSSHTENNNNNNDNNDNNNNNRNSNNRVRFDEESVIKGRLERSLSRTAMALDDDFFRLAQKNTLICLVAAVSSAVLLSIWSIGELSHSYLWIFTNLDIFLNSICVFCTLNCGRDWYPILFASCIRGLKQFNEFQIEREISQASREQRDASRTNTEFDSKPMEDAEEI